MNPQPSATIDPHWRDRFIVALRARDLNGSAIGASLAEVESHCADSPDSVWECFGPPEDYAAALALTPPPQARHQLHQVIALAIIGLLGLLACLPSIPAVSRGGSVSLSAGTIAITAAVLLEAIALMRRLPQILTFASRRPWWQAALVCGVNVAALAGIGLAFGTQAVLTLPALPVAAAGIVLLVINTVGMHLALRDEGPDRITPPTGQADPPGRGERALQALTPWLMPLITLIALAQAWLVGG